MHADFDWNSSCRISCIRSSGQFRKPKTRRFHSDANPRKRNTILSAGIREPSVVGVGSFQQRPILGKWNLDVGAVKLGLQVPFYVPAGHTGGSVDIVVLTGRRSERRRRGCRIGLSNANSGGERSSSDGVVIRSRCHNAIRHPGADRFAPDRFHALSSPR